jgi:UPF0176 protein
MNASEEPMDYRVLLYYHYVEILDPEAVVDEHLAYCLELGVRGRIYIAPEGINGTISGTTKQVDTYIQYMDEHPLFHGMVFKSDEAEDHAFNKMHVRVKPELVNFRLEEDVNPKEITGQYLEPAEFYERLQDPNTLVIDARNDYEHNVGHFKGAIKPKIHNFRELPRWIKENKELLKGKRIMAYCTGGVRCEKFTGWLKREGFTDVAQLHGGIVTYSKDPVAQGQFWEGQCYVFDKRLVVPINQVNPTIVGRDWFDGTPCERYINCANPECNRQILCSEHNEVYYRASCSDECRAHPLNRYEEKETHLAFQDQ